MGLNDIHNLAWKVNLQDRTPANSMILDTYESERKEAAMQYINYANLTGMRTTFLSDNSDDWRPQQQQRLGIMSNPGQLRGIAEQTEYRRKFMSGLGIEYSANMLNWSGGASPSASPSMLHIGHRVPNISMAQVSVVVPNNSKIGNLASKDKDKVSVSKQIIRLHDFLRDPQLFQILVLVGDPIITPGVVTALHDMDVHMRSHSSFSQRYRRRITGLQGGDLLHVLIITTSNKSLSAMPGLGFLKNYRVAVDEFGECHKKFGVDVDFGQGMVYVVRPDEIVGAVVTIGEFATLEEYFEEFLAPSL
ncbi:hypothetical protein BC936DRAFT_144554 [Jimgerdemannia flammicorona]|uniref:Phenol hydroxylase-like C-terminal dimerisation domain-containing protein n=1 Tax=Jimgerdemannia flammicorona TaxID=994334 RepID=A0A433DC67_9FUNG|nr:hypothetical protein BC936DRAFT_144554 [Jimgerdemannia flammicorona]